MLDLVPPPGYVAYPRDPRYRGLDAIDRLAMVGRGYLGLCWPGVLCLSVWFARIALGYSEVGNPYFFVLNLSLICLSCWMLYRTVRWIFGGKGWKLRYAILISLHLCLTSTESVVFVGAGRGADVLYIILY